jgi:hypothetical protein
MAKGIDVLGPFAPDEFTASNLTTISATLTTATNSLGTVVSVEPITIRGNVYVFVYTSS